MKHTKDNCTAGNLFLGNKCGLVCGNCLACECGGKLEPNKLEQLLGNRNIVKAYITPDKKFLKIENKNGAVLTIWEKWEGYQYTQPIEPNARTGSSVGEYDYHDYATSEEMLKKIETETQGCPSFFNEGDRLATTFLTIEQAVEQHGNILQFKQIEL